MALEDEATCRFDHKGQEFFNENLVEEKLEKETFGGSRGRKGWGTGRSSTGPAESDQEKILFMSFRKDPHGQKTEKTAGKKKRRRAGGRGPSPKGGGQ